MGRSLPDSWVVDNPVHRPESSRPEELRKGLGTIFAWRILLSYSAKSQMPVREGDSHRQERSVSRGSPSEEAIWKPEALPRDKCLNLCVTDAVYMGALSCPLSSHLPNISFSFHVDHS